MKILFACNSYPPHLGGAEKVCANMVDILSEQNEVTVLTQPHDGRKNMPNVVEMQGKTVYSYMPELIEYLNTHDFDLYISFGYGKYFTDYIGYWAKKHKKKSIVMPCGSFHTSSNLLFKKVYAAIATKWALNNYDIRITATQWEKDFWCNKFGVNPANTFVVPYNLESDFIKYKNVGLKKFKLKEKQYLLYIGRTGPNKLIQLLIDSYNHTSKKLPLVIAGKGTEVFGGIGSVSEDEKKTLIAGAKLCIFPSSYESFGMVLLESLALKTPVIGSSIGPFVEILKDNDLLFMNNIDSLSNRIEFAYTHDFKLVNPKLPNYKSELLNIINSMKYKNNLNSLILNAYKAGLEKRNYLELLQ